MDRDKEIVRTFPYDAKLIGDFIGLTPPFDHDHDADDQPLSCRAGASGRAGVTFAG